MAGLQREAGEVDACRPALSALVDLAGQLLARVEAEIAQHLRAFGLVHGEVTEAKLGQAAVDAPTSNRQAHGAPRVANPMLQVAGMLSAR